MYMYFRCRKYIVQITVFKSKLKIILLHVYAL